MPAPRKVTNGPQIVGKIVARTLGNPKAAAALDVNDKDAAHFLGEVGGIITGVKQVVDPRTEEVYHALVGNFIAIRGEDGQQIRSGVCYLPSGIHDMFASPFMSDDAPSSLEFRVELYTKPANNAAGYSYAMVSKHQSVKSDPLASLFGDVLGGAPALTDESEADEDGVIAEEAPKAPAKKR